MKKTRLLISMNITTVKFRVFTNDHLCIYKRKYIVKIEYATLNYTSRNDFDMSFCESKYMVTRKNIKFTTESILYIQPMGRFQHKLTLLTTKDHPDTAQLRRFALNVKTMPQEQKPIRVVYLSLPCCRDWPLREFR